MTVSISIRLFRRPFLLQQTAVATNRLLWNTVRRKWWAYWHSTNHLLSNPSKKHTLVLPLQYCPCPPAGPLCSASLIYRSAARVPPPLAGCCQWVSGCRQGKTSGQISSGQRNVEDSWVNGRQNGESRWGPRRSRYNTQLMHRAASMLSW